MRIPQGRNLFGDPVEQIPSALANEDPEMVGAAMKKLKQAAFANKLSGMAMTPEGKIYDARPPDGSTFGGRDPQSMMTISGMTAGRGGQTGATAGRQWGEFEQYSGDRNRMLSALGMPSHDPYEQLVGPRDQAGVGHPGGMAEAAQAMNVYARHPSAMAGLRRAAGSYYGG